MKLKWYDNNTIWHLPEFVGKVRMYSREEGNLQGEISPKTNFSLNMYTVKY